MFVLSTSFARFEFNDKQMRYSSKYYSGPYLIYDCLDNHWVCADKLAVTQCRLNNKLRETADKALKSCVIYKEYEKTKFCIEKNTQLVSDNASMRRCYVEKYFKKVILSQ
jgi:hypothetical protein